MSEDPKPADESQPGSEQDDDSKLDDLDPEEEGEDVVGGGFRPSSTSRSRFA
jgi:hypothetical protein